MTITAADAWKGSFTITEDLDAEYTVRESPVEHYEASVDYGADGAIITNSYKPEPPKSTSSTETKKPGTPSKTTKTGDDTNIALILGALIVSLGVIGAILYARRRSELQ